MEEYYKLSYAYRKVEVCAILRLLGTAFLVLLLADSSGNLHLNLERIFHGDALPAITVIGLTVDTILTFMWLIKPRIFKVHRILFIILGGIVYFAYSTVSGNVYNGMGPVVNLIFLTPILWGINLILVIIAGTGIKTINKAEEIRGAMEYDQEDDVH